MNSMRAGLCTYIAALTLFLAACGSSIPQGDLTSQQDDSASLLFPGDEEPAQAALPFAPDELLVQPFSGAPADAVEDAYRVAEARVISTLDEIQLVVLQVDPNHLIDAADSLLASGLFEAIHKNYIYTPTKIPNDPLFARQPHLEQVFAPDAWDVTVGSENILIAIVDTGVEPDHPDLKDKILGGWNVYNNDDDYSDVVGHGTLVAGVAGAASNNRKGVAGVTWDSPILVVRVTNNKGQSSARHLAAGILWSLSQGASVINVSFAPLWSNRVVRAAATQAFNRGSLVVISAGNGGGSTRSKGYREAVFVGAVGALNEIAAFSDRGPFVDMAAPGVGIRSTARGRTYETTNGTSFAAPIISGVAALMWAANPDLRPVTILQLITDGAIDVGSRGKDSSYGHGVIDAGSAVLDALETIPTRDDKPPTLRVTRPKSGARLSGRAAATVTATDDDAVADVVLSIDDIPYATDTSSPFKFVIETKDFSPGSHELSFVAHDVAGNASLVRVVPVSFTASRSSSSSNSTIEFKSPREGTTVSGDVMIQASVSDSDGLATVEWLVDGLSVFVSPVSGKSTGVSYLWRSNGARSGTHEISIIVTDAKGGQATGTLTLRRR